MPAPLHGKAVAGICRPQQLVLDTMHLHTNRHSAPHLLVHQSVSQSAGQPYVQTSAHQEPLPSVCFRATVAAGFAKPTKNDQTTQQNENCCVHIVVGTISFSLVVNKWKVAQSPITRRLRYVTLFLGHLPRLLRSPAQVHTVMACGTGVLYRCAVLVCCTGVCCTGMLYWCAILNGA